MTGVIHRKSGKLVLHGKFAMQVYKLHRLVGLFRKKVSSRNSAQKFIPNLFTYAEDHQAHIYSFLYDRLSTIDLKESTENTL